MACILMKADPMDSRRHCDEFEGYADSLHHVNSSLTMLASALAAVLLTAVLRTHTHIVANPSSMIRPGE